MKLPSSMTREEWDAMYRQRGSAIRKAMAENRRQGIPSGVLPLGYMATESEGGKRLIQIDPLHGPLLQEAFKMVSHGISLRQVTAWLRKSGIKGSRGGPVALSTVQRAISNPFYAGLVMTEIGQWITGTHVALISRNAFSNVQRKLLAKTHSNCLRSDNDA